MGKWADWRNSGKEDGGVAKTQTQVSERRAKRQPKRFGIAASTRIAET